MSKNVFVRGTFLRKNIADAAGATSYRRVQRNGGIKFRIVVCTQKFCSHADFTELAEAHRLRVLTMRDVCATRFSGWLRKICVVRVIFYFHTDSTEPTEAHELRVLTLRGVGATICAGGCRGRTLCRPVVNLRTITPIRNYVKYKFYIHNIGAQSHGLKGQ